MLIPRRTWLVYLIILASVLIFTISYRQKIDVRRLWHESLHFSGAPTYDEADKPLLDVEGPSSGRLVHVSASATAAPSSVSSAVSSAATQPSTTTSESSAAGFSQSGAAPASHPATTTHTTLQPTIDPNAHPIDTLIVNANSAYDDLQGKRTSGVAAAAKAYRDRRGRHPPPNFDKWVAYAEENGALMIEDMFDQIYQDLEPFWGVYGEQIRADAASWPFVISIRNGKAERHADESSPPGVYLNEWQRMLQEIEQHLPDVDMAFNMDVQPRVVVPWNTLSKSMEAAALTKTTEIPTGTEAIINEFSTLEPISSIAPAVRPTLWRDDVSYWWLARHACPNDSGARGKDLDDSFDSPPEFYLGHPEGTLKGYVSNWTLSKSVCEHPMLRNQHAAFVEPENNTAMIELFPLFGRSKIQGINNDILVPPIQYWLDSDAPDAIDRNQPWSDKQNRIIWRGRASGGSHDENNWTRFQRHRLVAMLNGTLVSAAEENAGAHAPATGSTAPSSAASSGASSLTDSVPFGQGPVGAMTSTTGAHHTTASQSSASLSESTGSTSSNPSSPAATEQETTGSNTSSSPAAAETSTTASTTTSANQLDQPSGYNSAIHNLPGASPGSANPYNNEPTPNPAAVSRTADQGPAQQSSASPTTSAQADGPPASSSGSASTRKIPNEDELGQSIAAATDATSSSTSASTNAATVSSSSSVAPDSSPSPSNAAPYSADSSPTSTSASNSAALSAPAAGNLSPPPVNIPEPDFGTDDAHTSGQGDTLYKRAGESPENFPLPADASAWPLSALSGRASKLGPWISTIADVGFVDFMCAQGSGDGGKCTYLDPYFEVVPFVNTSELYHSKYLLDVDGTSFSVGFRRHLKSGSVPIKATIFSEWHDSRLIAWKHFVPMDNTFIDIYGIIEYFMGYKAPPTETPGHDKIGEDIAASGKEWAEQVLRKEDMLIYMYRLVLEYARLCDDHRDNMGYVEDLA